MKKVRTAKADSEIHSVEQPESHITLPHPAREVLDFAARLVSRAIAEVSQNWPSIESLDLKPSDIIIVVPTAKPVALSPEAIKVRLDTMFGSNEPVTETVETITAAQALEELKDLPKAFTEAETEVAEAWRDSQLVELAAKALAGKPDSAPYKFIKKEFKDKAAKMTHYERVKLVTATFFSDTKEEIASVEKAVVPDPVPDKKSVKSGTKKADTPAPNEFAAKQAAGMKELWDNIISLIGTIIEVKKGTYTYDVWESCEKKVDAFEASIDNLKTILYPANSGLYANIQAEFAKLSDTFDEMKVPEVSTLLTDLSKEDYVGPFTRADWNASAILCEAFEGADDDTVKFNVAATKIYWYTKEEDAVRELEAYLKDSGETIDTVIGWFELTVSRRERDDAAKTLKVVKYIRETLFS